VLRRPNQPLLDIALALLRDARIGRDLVTVGRTWIHVQFARDAGVIQTERIVDILVKEPVHGTYRHESGGQPGKVDSAGW
jgi:hypothetical protein